MARRRAAARGFVADLDGPRLSVEAVDDAVLRVRFRHGRSRRPRRSWAIADPHRVGPPSSVDVVAPSPGAARLTTPRLEIVVDGDGTLDVRRTDGSPLVDQGRATADQARGATRWTHAMPGERLYVGTGERTGPLDRRGRRHTSWTSDRWDRQDDTTDALYVAIPWILALDPDGRAFGVLLDTTFKSVIDLADPGGSLVLEAETDELDWYLLDGPTPADVLRRLTALVGRTPLPPRWALGYHQARWGYPSAEAIRDVARSLRDHRIPADAIHLDIDHQDRRRPFSWDRRAFPDPPGLVRDLSAAGFRATVVADAYVSRNDDDPVYQAGRRLDAFVRESRDPDAAELTGFVWPGRSVWPDLAREEVAAWWDGLYAPYIGLGMAGFLNDMNEPTMHDVPMDAPGTKNVEPARDTPFGRGPDAATHAEVRNVYARLGNRAARESMVRVRSDRRPLLITRAGCTGVQQEAIVWSGDNRSTWEHLAMSLPQVLNLGLSGVAIAGADIGGFYEDCTPELLVRWTQLGALYPFARNNSANDTVRQEPWAFGEPTTSRCRRAIELRYRLLPYLYTVVEAATHTGAPVLRALLFEFPEDEGGRTIGDQAMLGSDLLLAPVLEPGASERNAWLPPGTWMDVRTGARYDGGERRCLPASLDDDVPLLARAGSIVPMGPALRWSDERPLNPLTLHLVPGEDGAASGELYEDDGDSRGYLRGAWSRTRFEASTDATGATRVTATRSGAWAPPPRTVELELHGTEAVRRTSVADAPSWTVTIPA
jgi:alpha-glucosidase